MANIEKLLLEFAATADRIEHNLSDMLTLVHNGRVPPKAYLEIFSQEFDDLRVKYTAIQELAAAVLPEGQFPDEDCSVHIYGDLIRAHETQLKQQADQLKAQLTRFISVQSSVDTFEDALLPFRAEASEMLAQLESSTDNIIPADIAAAAGNHRLFLQALSTTNFDSDDGLVLLEQLDAIFPSKVQRGLMLRKYFIPGEPAYRPVSVPVVEESPVQVAPVAPATIEVSCMEPETFTPVAAPVSASAPTAPIPTTPVIQAAPAPTLTQTPTPVVKEPPLPTPSVSEFQEVSEEPFDPIPQEDSSTPTAESEWSEWNDTMDQDESPAPDYDEDDDRSDELDPPRNYTLPVFHASNSSSWYEAKCLSQNNIFADFISNFFSDLYHLCKRNTDCMLADFALSYIERVLERTGRTGQTQDAGRMLIKSFPGRPNEVRPTLLINLLKELGFTATTARVNQTTNPNATMVQGAVQVRHDTTDKPNYAHPISIMGTELEPTLDILCLFGDLSPHEIISHACSLSQERTSIIFLNRPLDLASRQKLSERFHRETGGSSSFLLVDWVLVLYLALFSKTDRLPVLLNCAMPYTSAHQPFMMRGEVSPEMFYGRREELNLLLDRDGPTLVYGSNQVGKSALLRRACDLANQPPEMEYAILVPAGRYETEDGLVMAIVRELNDAGFEFSLMYTMRELYRELRDGYQKNWNKILLLIDDADPFLEAFQDGDPPYEPLLSLLDLSMETRNDFRFVLAGNEGVHRAACDTSGALKELSGVLCLEPLSQPDAYDLLCEPLQYMGFTLSTEQLQRILEQTGRNPALIHYAGYQLVYSLFSHSSDFYHGNGSTLPYTLTDEQLEELLPAQVLQQKLDDLTASF